MRLFIYLRQFMEVEFVVYILFSSTHQKQYTGYSNQLIQRFYSHNELSHKGWTRKYRPWKVVHVEFFKSKEEAMAREKFLKSGQGRQWIKEHISFD